MIVLAMLMWIGITLSAPVLYWVGWAMLAIYDFGKLLYKVYEIGTKNT